MNYKYDENNEKESDTIECNDCGNNSHLRECNKCEEYYCREHITKIFNRFEIKPEFFAEKEIGYFCEECFQEKLKKLIEE